MSVIVLFWQENGLSLTEIMILQSIFAILTVIFEIPTGYFADVYGRKKTLVIAGIMGLIAISAYSIGHNFFHFLIAEIFFALSISFASGTMSAFIYDTLQNLGQEETYKKIWGNALFYGMISLALSSIIGGFIAKIDLRYTLYASIPFFALLIPLTISMQEPKRHKFIFKKGYVKELLRAIKVALMQNKRLKWIIIYSGVIYAFNQSALWLYQPYFKFSGLDIVYFGFVFASFQVVSAFSSKYAHKIEEKLGQKYSLAMLIFLVAGSYFLMSNFVFLFSFSFCFIQQFVRGFKSVVVTDYINQLTTSNMRATVLSAESFVGRLLYAIIIPFIGLIADVYTIGQALTVLAITTFVSGIIILTILRKNKVI
ncbi:MFS transporter [bacterium]|nr:MFS transporter [bacterium]